MTQPSEQLYVETAGNTPTDPKLWGEVKTAAKKKFTVYPSAYANGWAVQEYKRRGGTWKETAQKKGRVPVEAADKSEGLGLWFAEKWVDISRTNNDGSHPACGRPSAGMSQSDYAKAYPKCVPASRAARMSPAQKKDAVARKRDADNANGDGKGQKPKMVDTTKSADQPSATKKDQNPKGGLSAAGRKKFGVKKGVTGYAGASEPDQKRWVRWALRFTKTPRPLKDDQGRPTRYALMFRAWGEPVPTSAAAVRAVHTKAVSRAKTLKMGQYQSASMMDVIVGDDEAAAELTGWEYELATVHLWEHERERLGRPLTTLVAASPAAPQQADTVVLGPARPTGLGAQIVPAPPDPVDADSRPDTRAQEDAAIATSAKSPAAGLPHPFMPAVYDDANDQPRCRLCGNGTPTHTDFQPETPTTAQLTQRLSTATAHERLAPVIAETQPIPEPSQQQKAFVTETGGRTLITGPASAFYRDVQRARAGNEHFLWMNGRFVGAERANRNNAFWSAGDLELGQVSVQHGPLNWLHEGRHVIGTIAKARMVTPGSELSEPASEADSQLAATTEQPHIEAASAIWRWIYPDEAWVIEQASDAGKLFYSMECISKEVECAGETGCGARASYGDYVQGKQTACEHLTQRSGVRRFVEPTFLGGAVIVPPIHPGWAEADAQVMRQASMLAEKAYDQAGRPDTPASEWEQLMAQVLRYGAGA